MLHNSYTSVKENCFISSNKKKSQVIEIVNSKGVRKKKYLVMLSDSDSDESPIEELVTKIKEISKRTRFWQVSN